MRISVKAVPAALVLFVAMTSAAFSIEASFTCSGGVSLEATFSDPSVSPGSVVLAFAGAGEITLPQVMSADGGRYAEGDVEFWVKGKGATLTRNGKTETCQTK